LINQFKLIFTSHSFLMIYISWYKWSTPSSSLSRFNRIFLIQIAYYKIADIYWFDFKFESRVGYVDDIYDNGRTWGGSSFR